MSCQKKNNNESRQCKITDEEKACLNIASCFLLHKEPAYASDIIQKLKEAQLIVVEGTLYPLLTRLKNDDLLSYEWVESTQDLLASTISSQKKERLFLGELEISWKELGRNRESYSQ